MQVDSWEMNILVCRVFDLSDKILLFVRIFEKLRSLGPPVGRPFYFPEEAMPAPNRGNGAASGKL